MSLTAFQKSAFQYPGFQIHQVAGADFIRQRRRRELNYYLDRLMEEEDARAKERAEAEVLAEARRAKERRAREQRALLALASQSRAAFSHVAPVLAQAA